MACDHWMFKNRHQIFIEDHVLNKVDSPRDQDQRPDLFGRIGQGCYEPQSNP